MSRLSYPRAGEPRPAALPPETRTVGQLVAETIRLYGARFWAVLPLGVVFCAIDIASFRRSVQLSRADLVHAIAGLATLALVYGLSKYALLLLLHTQGDQTQRIAAGVADVVLSPLLFLGSALLYVDQAARVE